MTTADTEHPLIVFTPSGKRGRFKTGTKILDAAQALGVDIETSCGGRAVCGKCQVTPAHGEFAKHGISCEPQSLGPITDPEIRFRIRKGLAEDRRLSCQTTIEGDLVIDVPASSQLHDQVIRKDDDGRQVTVAPLTRLFQIEVEKPDMHDPSSDLERVFKALGKPCLICSDCDQCSIDIDFSQLPVLQKALRDGDWKVTLGVHGAQERVITAIWPGFKEKVFGLAVDVGSTTIAAHLCDLSSGKVVSSSGVMNPQIRFGEDLMSRVSYVMMNPGGDVEMTRAVREAINELAAKAAKDAGVDRSDIVEVVLVGNPVMHHLLLGIDPIELGGAPFALSTGLAINTSARDLDLDLAAGAKAYVLPCIAGHVGADAAAVTLSEKPYLSDEIMLVVDVGTNAEIILGNKDRLLACSSPTGPAFEGAQISCGQRAAPGAIERVRIDRDTLEPVFKIIGSDLWSDEEGFDEAVGKTGVTGICGSGIIEVIAEMFLSGIIDSDGRIDGSLADRSDRIFSEGRTFSYRVHRAEQTLCITQNDVRAIQLAKAALYAGVQLLMDKLSISHVDKIALAGAFGSHIDVKYAMVLGLIPDCDLEKVKSVGNAAGAGARIALLDGAAREEIETVVQQIEKIETAVETRFQEHFVNAMALPHKSVSFPNLEKQIRLPMAKTGDLVNVEGKKRRRRNR